MNLRQMAVACTMAALLAGCTGVVKGPTPGTNTPPVTNTPPSKVEPSPAVPAKTQWPNSIGSYREALGPGLVLQGHTNQDKVKVEVRVGGQTLRSEEVSSKDGGPGYWSVVWPAPQATAAEALLINPADGSILARGAISPSLHVGLFHSSLFADTRVDAKVAESKVRVTGQVRSGERIRVEFWDPTGKLVGSETVEAKQGAFDASLPWPEGAHQIYFYTLGSKDTPQLGLIIPIIAR